MTATYPIQSHTFVCAATGRPLQTGEKYFSALFDEAGHWVRRDYSAAGWPGQPQDAVAFWAGKVPPQQQKARLTFDDELLMDCFVRLAEDSDQRKMQFRYVVALLLLRRKRLKFDDLRKDGEHDYMLMKCPRTACTFEVRDPHLGETDIEQVQQEVFKVLGWE